MTFDTKSLSSASGASLPSDNSSLASQLATQLQYLSLPSHDQQLDEIASSPLLTLPVLNAGPVIQHGLLGADSKSSRLHGTSKGNSERLSARIFQNVTAPSSTFICGSQGSGKSNTLACMLENCLLPSELGTLPHPLTGIVFHYDGFNSDVIGLPCEAAFLASDLQVKVRVLCAPTNVRTIEKTYGRIPNVVIEPFQLRDEDLNTQRMLNLMAIGDGNIPLYMHVVNRILREMRIRQQASGGSFSYAQFKAEIADTELTVAQSSPLQQRLDTLESFMVPQTPLFQKKKKKTPKGNDWTPQVRFSASKLRALLINRQPKQLIIVDLSCPCVTPEMACSLFNIALHLFLEGDRGVSRVVALDEAHKYMRDTSPESSIFTENLLGVIRLQRHLGTRVIISTQEPTVSTKLLDLCSVAIIHRFTSPDWLHALQKHLAGVSSLAPAGGEGSKSAEDDSAGGVSPVVVTNKDPAAELFSLIVGLRTGQALVFSPSSIINHGAQQAFSEGPSEDGSGELQASETFEEADSGGMDESSDQSIETLERLGHRALKVDIRARLTSDGGRSIMAL